MPYVTCLDKLLSKYAERQTSRIENDITRTWKYSRQIGMIMRTIFGIDLKLYEYGNHLTSVHIAMCSVIITPYQKAQNKVLF